MKKIVLFLFVFFFPFSVFASELIPNAESGILIEMNSGKILFEKEINKEVSVASMTKMVAQILIMEAIEEGKIHWDDVVTVSKNASAMGGSQIYLETGEKMTVEDLMKGISVASGNDATVAMAEYISGTEEKFVKEMNEKVKELGLQHTHFMNSTGLDEENHYSSSYDMAMIARYLIKNHPDILKFSSLYEDYLREGTSKKFWLVNTNKLLRQYEGVDGLKTGHTTDAGYCLAATAKKNDLRLIGIVLGEKDSKVRNKETMDLLDYGFKNVELETLKKKGTSMKTLQIPKSTRRTIPTALKENLVVVEEIGEKGEYVYQEEYFETTLPIQKGDVVGKLKVLLEGKEMGEVDIITLASSEKLNFFSFFLQEISQLFFGNF